MKKTLLFLIMAMTLLLDSCSDSSAHTTESSIGMIDYVDMVVLDEDFNGNQLLVDRKSGVLYYSRHVGTHMAEMSVIYDSEGKPKTFRKQLK